MTMRPRWWPRKSPRAARAGDPVRGTDDAEPDQTGSRRRFTSLRERVNPKDTVTTQRTDPHRDPEGGRDTDRDFLLRYGAGGDEGWDPTDG